MAFVRDWTWTYNTSTSATNISGALPLYYKNDLLLLVPSTDTGTQTYTASGYTQLVSVTNTSNIGMLFRVANLTEANPVSATYSVAETANLRVISIGDVNTNSPFATIWQGLGLKQSINWYSLNGTMLRVAQSFRGSGETISKCRFYLKKTGVPNGDITAVIYNHTGTFGSSSVPSTTVYATSNPVPANSLSTTGSWIEFTFPTPYTTAINTYYTIAVVYTGTSSNTVDVAYATSTASTVYHAGNAATYTGTTWTAAASNDLYHFINSNNGFFSTAFTTMNSPVPDVMSDYDNTLILYLSVHSSPAIPQFLIGAVMEDGSDGSAHSDAFSWSFLPKALTPNKELVYHTSVAAAAGAIIVVGIRSSSDTNPEVRPPIPIKDNSIYVDPINGVTAYNSNTAFAATYTTNFASTLNGKTAANGTVAAAADVGLHSFHSLGQLTGSTTSGTWAGATLVLNANNYIDATNKNIICHVKPSTPKVLQTTDLITKNPSGVAFGVFSTAASAWKMYHVHGAGTLWNSATHVPIVINPNSNYGLLGSAGTLDTSSIKGFGFAVSGFTVAPIWQFGSLWILDTTVIVGGTLSNPLKLFDIYKASALGKERMSFLIQGSTEGLLLQPLQIGDGENLTIADLSVSTIEVPPLYSKEAKTVFYCSNENIAGITLYLSNNDVVDLTSTTFISKNKYHFRIHPNSSLFATLITKGLNIINAGDVQLDVYDFNSINISNCQTVYLNNASLSNCKVYNSTIYCNSTYDLARITYTDFSKDAGSGHAIVVNSIDIDNIILEECYFEGYANTNGNTGNEAIFINAPDGTLTINIIGDSVPSIRTSGATVIVNKSSYLTLTGLVLGSEVRIYDANTNEELFGIESVDTSSVTYVYPYTSDRQVNIVIFHVNYKDIIIPYTLTASSGNLPIQQIYDRNYKND